MIEANKNHLFGHSRAVKTFNNSLLNARVINGCVLDLDVDHRVAFARPDQHFVERRNPLTRKFGREPRACVQFLEFGQRVVLNQSVPIGRPIHELVVNNGQRAVARQVNVQFYPICAQLERALERDESVFGAVAHRPAMANDPHPPAPEVGESTPSQRQAFNWCLSHTPR